MTARARARRARVSALSWGASGALLVAALLAACGGDPVGDAEGDGVRLGGGDDLGLDSGLFDDLENTCLDCDGDADAARFEDRGASDVSGVDVSGDPGGDDLRSPDAGGDDLGGGGDDLGGRGDDLGGGGDDLGGGGDDLGGGGDDLGGGGDDLGGGGDDLGGGGDDLGGGGDDLGGGGDDLGGGGDDLGGGGCGPDACAIDGACYAAGEGAPDARCFVCRPSESTTAWSVRDGAEVCADGDVCTEDVCDPTTGACRHDDNRASCDDGYACTTGDRCLAGVCLGDPSGCACEPRFSERVCRATDLEIGEDGRAGNGLDVDGDAGTCAPAGRCEAGIDNALASLGSYANANIQEAIDAGSLNLLFELREWGESSFVLAFHAGTLDPDNRRCDLDRDFCAYEVYREGLDAVCEPAVTLPARRSGSRFSAGGDDATVPLRLPIDASTGATLGISLRRARAAGSITTLERGRVELDGVIAGAVRRTDLVAALEELPPGTLPVDVDTLTALLELLVRDDIDTNGDGVADAISVGLPFSSIAASISGLR